jgi:hypothetical protein
MRNPLEREAGGLINRCEFLVFAFKVNVVIGVHRTHPLNIKKGSFARSRASREHARSVLDCGVSFVRGCRRRGLVAP